MGYSGTLWMTFDEEFLHQMSVCLHRIFISVQQITHKDIQNSTVEKPATVNHRGQDGHEENGHGDHLDFKMKLKLFQHKAFVSEKISATFQGIMCKTILREQEQ